MKANREKYHLLNNVTKNFHLTVSNETITNKKYEKLFELYVMFGLKLCEKLKDFLFFCILVGHIETSQLICNNSYLLYGL